MRTVRFMLALGLLSVIMASSTFAGPSKFLESERSFSSGASQSIDIAIEKMNFLPAYPNVGEEINIKVLVTNFGDIGVEANWHYEIVGAGFGACACCLNLGPGESEAFGFSFTPEVAGKYNVLAYSIPENIEDHDMENNFKSVEIIVD